MYPLEIGREVSRSIAEISHPSNPLYYPYQILLVSGLSYTGTVILNVVWIISTPPIHGMIFTVTAFIVHEVVSRIFIPSFQPEIEKNLSPLASRFLQWTVSLLTAKVICAIFDISIKLSQIGWICLGFFIAYRIMLIAIETFRNSLNTV